MAKTEHFRARVEPGTTDELRAIALALDMTYGGKPSPSLLLEAITQYKDTLIPFFKLVLKKKLMIRFDILGQSVLQF